LQMTRREVVNDPNGMGMVLNGKSRERHSLL
jgi:hypothetical protein